MPRKPRETTHLRIRVEPPLLARLEKGREKSRRTLTGEIVHRLEQSFRREDQEELIRATVQHMIGTASEGSLMSIIKDLPPDQQAGLVRQLFPRLFKESGEKPSTFTDQEGNER